MIATLILLNRDVTTRTWLGILLDPKIRRSKDAIPLGKIRTLRGLMWFVPARDTKCSGTVCAVRGRGDTKVPVGCSISINRWSRTSHHGTVRAWACAVAFIIVDKCSQGNVVPHLYQIWSCDL